MAGERSTGSVSGDGTAAARPVSPSEDPRRWWWLEGLNVPALPLYAALLQVWFGGYWSWYLAPALVFLWIPWLDYRYGRDLRNMAERHNQGLFRSRYHRLVLELYIPLQIIGYLVATVAFADASSWGERIGIACTAGTVAGISTNPAHELGHRMEKVGKYLALLGLSQMGYAQFYVEHNRGHHRRVATPEDPASARYNESLWHFMARSAIFSHRSAIELERKRLRGRGKTFWSPSNALLIGWAMSVVLWGFAFAVIGPLAVVFVAIQAFFGIYLVEAVNYLGHYGLARRKLPNGRYEPTNPNHSWNCNQWASNIFLFHLPRHSDHHENPLRPYHTVRDVPGYPTLPHGYPSMILIASVPPLWYRIMNPRLLALYDNDESLVNRGPVD